MFGLNCNYTAYKIEPLLAVLNQGRLPNLIELASAISYDGKSSINLKSSNTGRAFGSVDRVYSHNLSASTLIFVHYNCFSTTADNCMIESSQIMLTRFFSNKKNSINGIGHRLNSDRFSPEEFLHLAIVRFVMNCVKIVESMAHCLNLNREVTASDLRKHSGKLTDNEIKRLKQLLHKFPDRLEEAQVCILILYDSIS